MNNKTKQITYTGLMAAMIFIGTKIINIPTPKGYVHIGDAMIFISAILLDWKYAAIASGIGSGLADLLSPYAIYTIPTLVIKSIMSILISVSVKGSRKSYVNISLLSSSIWALIIITLRYLLNKNIIANPSDYISSLEHLGISTNEQVITYVKSISSTMLVIGIIFPLFILCVALFTSEKNTLRKFVGFTIAGMWMVFGYYAFEAIYYHQYLIPVLSIPFNVLQFFVGSIIAQLAIAGIQRGFIINKY